MASQPDREPREEVERATDRIVWLQSWSSSPSSSEGSCSDAPLSQETQEKKLINAASCQQASLQTASWASPENTSFGSYGIVEHNQPTSSGTVDRGSEISVKITYKKGIIRFMFEPSAGCLPLYEEVAKSFNLQKGTFQLKYLDDENDWILLLTDLHLQKCLKILDLKSGTRIVRLLVRDKHCNTSSLAVATAA